MARLHRDVMRVLVMEIVTGIRPAGEMLPKETDLATRFDVSRGVARETIRAMEERGLISVRHGKGATINEPSQWDLFDPDVLAATLESDLGSDVLGEYLECRRILEIEAAGLAAERAQKSDLEPISEALARMEELAQHSPTHVSEDQFHEADVAFHQALISATNNWALAGLVDRLQSALLVARYPLARPDYRQERALPEHRRIFAAVASGNAEEARKAMSEHLDTIAGYLLERRDDGATAAA
jgi:DNA-binding FadR family transcriptional regulator